MISVKIIDVALGGDGTHEEGPAGFSLDKNYEWRKLIHVTPPGPTVIVTHLKKLVIVAITQVKRVVAWCGTANLDLHVAKWSGARASERMEHRL